MRPQRKESTPQNGTNVKTQGDVKKSEDLDDAEVIELDDNSEEMSSLVDKESKIEESESQVSPSTNLVQDIKGIKNDADDISGKEEEHDLELKKEEDDLPDCSKNHKESVANEKAKFEKQKSVQPDNEKKDRKSSIVDNQVQCVNLHCQSGYHLSPAPVFVLTYFRASRRKNVLQKVCKDCFEIALRHQKKMCNLLAKGIPLMSAEFPNQKDDVVVMDSVEEIYEEEVLPHCVISLVEKELTKLMNKAVDKYKVDYQLEKGKEILTEKFEALEVWSKEMNSKLDEFENTIKQAREAVYKHFIPKIKSLPPLNITGQDKQETKPIAYQKGRCVALKKTVQMRSLISKGHPFEKMKPLQMPPQNSESHDVVAVKEVEVPRVKLPPIGTLVYPSLYVGSPVFVMKVSFFGVWVRGRIMEIISRPNEPTSYRIRFDSSYHGGYKIATGKQIAYSKPSPVRYPVGTRVVALFHNTESPGKDAFYAGVIAEPPKILNVFRYLVFFDDGYAQYVSHDKILLVCEASKFVYQDIHPDSREFIKNYLNQYPERPMVKLQKGQVVKTEWNGKWWLARVVSIDVSLVKMHFEADNRTEWIYRGSTRLGPLYSEIVAAAARKEQGALSRHRSLGIASLRKRNLPYVEYSVDQDDAKSQTPVSKNVAKKSTASRTNAQDISSGPPKPNEKMEITTKGYIRTINLANRKRGLPFTPHQCGPSCIEWTKFTYDECKGINPLAIPLLYGFERQVAIYKGKKTVMYRSPCGRRLRNVVETHRYLRLTKSTMGLDLFDYDYWVGVLDEFHLEPTMYCSHIKDISYGHENTPVSCVNEINHSWPSFMNYSTKRIPQEGVKICLDEEFLVCCSCTDDCQDKEKCECWQLTIEGAKFGSGGPNVSQVGYEYKRLLEPVPTGIYECNQRCKCARSCLNRVAQHPLQLNLQVFRTLKKGWGLRTLNDIPQGGFICIYAGRLHTEQSANDDGRMYGDEYLAELDYIEVVERFKEGYESDVIDPSEEGKVGGEENESREADDDDENLDEEEEEMDESQMNSDDTDYVPQGLNRIPLTDNIVNTRGRRKKIIMEKQSENRGEKEVESAGKKECINLEEDDYEMKKKPSKFNAEVVEEEKPKYRSVREMFGDGADDCYIMDAKSSGNIGRYLNHSCQPNVFVQNVFVDTHDVRFPWVAFFALTYISAGTELTWDYNYDIGSVPGKVLYCYCNSSECRGRLL